MIQLNSSSCNGLLTRKVEKIEVWKTLFFLTLPCIKEGISSYFAENKGFK